MRQCILAILAIYGNSPSMVCLIQLNKVFEIWICSFSVHPNIGVILMSMHHTKKHFLAWSINQLSLSPIINHHEHCSSYCRRHVGVNLINQSTLREIIDELHLRPVASSILNVNASSIHTRDELTILLAKPERIRESQFNIMTDVALTT